MAALLSGLLGAIGGPQKIIQTVGGFVGDILGGIAKKQPFGKILATAGEKAIRGLIPPPIQPSIQLADQRPIIVPLANGVLGGKKILAPAIERSEVRARIPKQDLRLIPTTPAGFPASTILRQTEGLPIAGQPPLQTQVDVTQKIRGVAPKPRKPRKSRRRRRRRRRKRKKRRRRKR